MFGRDHEITELAASMSPESLRRKLNAIVDEITNDDGLDRATRQQAEATVSMKIDDKTGMHTLYARLTPEAGNRIRRALDHEAAALAELERCAGLRRDQILAVALEHIVVGDAVASGMGPAEVAVLIDLRTLIDLRAMYRTCAIDGCDQHFDRCHVHHILEWEHHGPTDLDNLLPVCGFHHHRLHEGRWRVHLEPGTRRLTIRLPDGSLHSTSSPDHVGLRATG